MATLDALEGTWPKPDEGATFLVRRCHELRRTEVTELTVEDLRILIGQRIGLRWLVPLAIERLENDPLASGDLYEGDLFASLAGVADSFWATDTTSWLRLRAVAELLVTNGQRAESWLARTRGGA